MSQLRQNLGDFSSIVCFKAVVVGVEEALGKPAARVALISAGRKRGKGLVESLGLAGQGKDLNVVCQKLHAALGADGTRLCQVNKIEMLDGVLRVEVSETVCMAGEEQGTDRVCTFTLGAVHGALESLTGRLLKGKHTESPWRGQAKDVFEFTDRV